MQSAIQKRDVSTQTAQVDAPQHTTHVSRI